jgi:hypothetical protein
MPSVFGALVTPKGSGCDRSELYMQTHLETLRQCPGAALIAVLAISAPTFGVTVLSAADPSLQGTTIAVKTFTISEQASGQPAPSPVDVFFVDEKVVQNAAGTLDFYFKLRNVSEPQSLSDFGILYPNSIAASQFYIDEGNLAPSRGTIDSIGNQAFADYSFGDVIGFGPLLGPGGTDTLLLRTNTNSLSSGGISVSRHLDDFDIQPVTGLVPAASSVPEPSALALLSIALAGLTIKFRLH